MPSLLILSASLGVVSRRKSITCIGIGLRLNQKVLKTITCIAEAKVSQLSDLSHLHRVVAASASRALIYSGDWAWSVPGEFQDCAVEIFSR